ncbi:hypothetical protein DFP73DRAFT_230484 [Morchella snyderi]|nr:hypothetical protein DFP73DRAFT_230484 [Morchella snyderi]
MYYIIWELFVFCITTYKESIPSTGHKVGEDKGRAKLQEEIGRLLLWGDSYAVSKGKLDILFENTKNKYLKESTVILLCSIARALDTYFSNINDQSPKRLHGVPMSPRLRSNIIAAHINNEHTTQPTSTEEPIDQACGEGRIKEPLQNCNDRAGGGAESPTREKILKFNLSRPPTMLDLKGLLGLVQTLMPDIASLVKQDPINNDSSNSDSDDEPLESDLFEIVGDLRDSLDSLFDLITSIDELCPVEEEEEEGNGEEEEEEGGIPTKERHEKVQPHPIKFITPIYSAATQSYRVNIRSRFPKIEDHLVETLAELNWERIERIRSRRLVERKALIQETKGQIPYGEPSPDPIAYDSEFTLLRYLNSEIEPLKEFTSKTPASVPSASPSTVYHTPSDKTPVPRAYDGLGSLRPYSCLFSYCPWKSNTYAKRDDWVAHEFEHHRPHNAFEWHCSGTCAKVFREREEFVRHILKDHLEGVADASDINDILESRKVKISKACNDRIFCPFCSEVIPETKESIEFHIGTHMDEVALMAFSASLEDESNKPIKHESSGYESLHTPHPINQWSPSSQKQSQSIFNNTSQTLANIPAADLSTTRTPYLLSPPRKPDKGAHSLPMVAQGPCKRSRSREPRRELDIRPLRFPLERFSNRLAFEPQRRRLNRELEREREREPHERQRELRELRERERERELELEREREP